MKYGDEFYVRNLSWHAGDHGPIKLRFRIDPVPYFGTHKHWICPFRHPHIMNEKRQWDGEYGRRKRNVKNLPDAWDDITRSDYYTRKCWKSHKLKRQWMKHVR